MHHVHLKDVHVPKGPNLFAFSIGEIVCSALALIFFLISWGVGGEDFKNSIGGNYTLAVLFFGIVLGAVFARLTKPNS